jgi:hypothetical protein
MRTQFLVSPVLKTQEAIKKTAEARKLLRGVYS